jgi:hypothetical protein
MIAIGVLHPFTVGTRAAAVDYAALPRMTAWITRDYAAAIPRHTREPKMLEQLLADGWGYHDTDSARLAGELEAVSEVAAALLADFMKLATHTIGDHLGDWPRALGLGRRILAGHAPDEHSAPAWARLAVAAVLAGDAVGALELELAGLAAAADPLACVLATRLEVAQAMVDAGRDDGVRIYRGALALAVRPPIAPSLDRVIAATSNNLAWTLHDRPARSPDLDAVMQLAAGASLVAWRRCGDWINEQQALYLSACVGRAVGALDDALALAGSGLAVIAAHGERPFDAARLHLVRASVCAARGDTDGHAEALAAADAAAGEIAIEALKPRYASERARVAARR